MKMTYSSFYALLAVSIVCIDRLTKYAVMFLFPYYKVSSFLSIDLVYNRGISFGIFHSDNGIIFAAVNLLIISVIGFLIVHANERLVRGKSIVGEICIFAGAMSNVLDRYLYGGVVDFIAFSYRKWHFAVFNIADVFIFCGVVLMVILEYRASCKKN